MFWVLQIKRLYHFFIGGIASRINGANLDPDLAGISKRLELGSIFNTTLSVQERISYYFYNQTVNGIAINRNNVTSFGIKSTGEFVFIIHGWINSYLSEMPQEVKGGYLNSTEYSDYNIILVDWSKMSYKDYITAKRYTPYVGREIGAFITFLEANVGLNLTKTGLVGHSLGAHVAGIAGKSLNGLVDRLIGT